MLFENVNGYLLNALQESKCFMYQVPVEMPFNIETVDVCNILSIYSDIIIVYNYDKTRVKYVASNLVGFKVIHLDDYNHVFTVAKYIPDDVIDMVRIGDKAVLSFIDDSTAEAIALALSELDELSRCNKTNYFSSLGQLPVPIQCEIYQDKDLFNRLEIPFKDNLYSTTEDITKNHATISHYAPIEQLQAAFEPMAMTDRGKYRAGFFPDEKLPLENLNDNEYPIALEQSKLGAKKIYGGKVKIVDLDCYKVANKVLYPALIDVVDVDDVIDEDPVENNTNPIGYIEKNKA